MNLKLIILMLACYTAQAGLSIPDKKHKLKKIVSLNNIMKNNDATSFGSTNSRKQLLVNLARRDLTNIDGIELLEINKKRITNFAELELRVDKSLLTTIPDSIGLLTNMVELDLCLNKITSLPEAVGNLNQLRKLFLMDNKLNSLPNSIGNLIKLEFFYLNNNCLKQLPDSINNLLNIEKLDLENNKLITFPNGRLKEIANLNGYNLNENANVFIQISVAKKLLTKFSELMGCFDLEQDNNIDEFELLDKKIN